MSEPLHGHCLCGAVKFNATPKKMAMGVCHCSMCRRWTGGVLMSVDCGASVKIEGEQNLGVYRSSGWGERCFCKLCGSTLFWRMQNGAITVVSAQAFEHPEAFHFESEIFIDSKPDNYAFANNTKKMTEAEVVAMFAPKG